jgi:hypothetical protein
MESVFGLKIWGSIKQAGGEIFAFLVVEFPPAPETRFGPSRSAAQCSHGGKDAGSNSKPKSSS